MVKIQIWKRLSCKNLYHNLFQIRIWIVHGDVIAISSLNGFTLLLKFYSFWRYFWNVKRIHTCFWSWQHFHGVDEPSKRTNQFNWIKLWKRLIFIFHLEIRLIMIFSEFGELIHHFLKRTWLNHAGNKSRIWPRQFGLTFLSVKWLKLK